MATFSPLCELALNDNYPFKQIINNQQHVIYASFDHCKQNNQLPIKTTDLTEGTHRKRSMYLL